MPFYFLSQLMKERHSDFSVKESGLWIHPDHPHIGASPDAISSCSCHGSGCVEIKCPFCARDAKLSEAINYGAKLCLKMPANNSDGALTLCQNHPYWYQVQVQLSVTKYEYADFVVWTKQDIHIERINRDTEFFDTKLSKVNDLYVSAILPELLAKWHTSPKVDNSDLLAANALFCYCRAQFDDSLVLICGNYTCLFKKFHLKCCGLSRRPYLHKVWFCPDCRRQKRLCPPATAERHI